MGYDISMPASIGVGQGGFIMNFDDLPTKQQDMLKEIVNTGNYEERAFARKFHCEDLYECNRENVVLMRVKTYMRSLTLEDLILFGGKIMAFLEVLLKPRTQAEREEAAIREEVEQARQIAKRRKEMEELPNSESIKEVLDG